MSKLPPVVTIDGPSGVGKGTIAERLARQLQWHYLDSGAVYRLVAWAALQKEVRLDDVTALKHLIDELNVRFELGKLDAPVTVYCDDIDVSYTIRTTQIAQIASKISSIPEVREALLQFQRDQRCSPGLVTDGRDMGTVVFPDATVKFFFVADPLERAKRRLEQLKQRGISVSLPDIEHEITERDQRDQNRAIAPLRPAEDALLIDTTQLTIDQVLDKVVGTVKDVLGGLPVIK